MELDKVQGQLISDYNYVKEDRKVLKSGKLKSFLPALGKAPDVEVVQQLFLFTDCLLLCERRRKMTSEAEVLREVFLEKVVMASKT